MLLRLTLYATLGLVLDALGQSVTGWGFWAVVGLFWASETLTRVQLVEQIQEEVAEWKRKHPEQNKDNSNG